MKTEHETETVTAIATMAVTNTKQKSSSATNSTGGPITAGVRDLVFAEP